MHRSCSLLLDSLKEGDPPIFEKQTILTIAEALHIRNNSFGIYYFTSLLNAAAIELIFVPAGKREYLL